MHNVYILPGVPWLFKQMLEANKTLFTGPLMTSAAVYTKSGEGDLAAALTVRSGTSLFSSFPINRPCIGRISVPEWRRGLHALLGHLHQFLSID